MLLQSLKGLVARGKEGGGPLTGRTIKVGSYLVKVENVLGEGGFATIYRCSDNTTRAAFALKHFRLSGHPEALADVHQEVAVMRALHECPYALHLRAVAFAGGAAGAEEEAFMLLDLCRDNLVSFLQARRFSLDDHTVLAIFLPVCRAVQAMHSLDPALAHRDLKAENVLLHANGQWVLCDFGSSTSQQQVYSQPREIAIEEERIRKHTTPAYRAPEMWDLYAREFIGLKVDIWALGCLLYLLCFGRLPFDGDAKLQILNGHFTLPPQRPEPLRDLIRGMLVVDSKQRLGIDEVMCQLEQCAPTDLLRPLPTAAASQQHHPAAPPSQGCVSSPGPHFGGPHLPPGLSHGREAAAPQPSSRSFAQGAPQTVAAVAAAETAALAPSPAAPQPSAGLFWQTQAAAPQEDQEGWASFGSGDHGAVLEASLTPPSGVVTPPHPPSAVSGTASPAEAQDTSWVSFNASSPTRAGPSGQPQSAMPPPSAPLSAMEEGPLSAGFRALVSSAMSPFSASRQAPGASTQAPGASIQAPGASTQAQLQSRTTPSEPIMGRMAVEPVPMASRQSGVITPAASRGLTTSFTSAGLQSGLGSQPQSRTTSEAGLPRHTSPFRPGYPSGSSLPASPKHSRESSRTMDALSRSSGQGADDTENLQLRASQLEETCKVLEQLLEMKTEELMVLREENARQARELAQLRQELDRQRRQQEQQQLAAQEQGAGATPQPLSRSSSLGSGREGQLKVEVPSQEQGSSWIAFNASENLDQGAPTPTLLQPSVTKGSQQAQKQAQQQHPSPATPLAELLQAKLDLVPRGAGAATLAPSTAALPQQQQRTPQGGGSNGTLLGSVGSTGSFSGFVEGAGGSGSGGNDWSRALPFEEFNPLVHPGEAEAPRPLREGGSGKARGAGGFSSVQPSPAKPMAPIGGGNSPLKTRPSSGMAAGGAGSPTACGGHRRQVSAPFFSDLNPLGS